ncbi:MAG: glycosyltransferase [Verrucomicrobia bacterium]|nr:glycosyltransferase [Verrucomicrobiota bacterium]
MRILHTESSRGWGGQEIRILREAEGMRARGHEVILAVNSGGGLIPRARAAGFTVYEVPFSKGGALKTVFTLLRILQRHQIDLINTHSSLDAWLGGIAARLKRKKILRTRHLSTPIRAGLNSRLLYKGLADYVATTSSGILPVIAEQSGQKHLSCVPTGIDPEALLSDEEKVLHFRKALGVMPDEILVGTVCFVRSWKGILDLLQAALLLKEHKEIKWVVVGGGYVDEYRPKVAELGLTGVVTFTGHLEPPFDAIRGFDIFTLLSTAHEGISQASLQAAYLERPLITTSVGGLPEVCIDGKTGYVVPPRAPEAVAKAVLALARSPELRGEMGRNARLLVESRFTMEKTLDSMEKIYHHI